MFNLISYYKKNKKELIILIILLVFLILPRIASYWIFGTHIIAEQDSVTRYFPQVEALQDSFKNFFNQTGPLYSLFLLFFKLSVNDIMAVPVFVQHILGLVAALLVFHYLKKINLWLAFIVTLFSFANPVALWLEHSILREALVSFFIVLMIILITRPLPKFSSGFLAGLFALALFFLRVEFLALVILIPLILFILKKRKSADFSLKKWTLGYFTPFVLITFIYLVFASQAEIGTNYGSYFNIAYHGLQPEVFYYQDSQYPELLEGYQLVLEQGKSVSDSMSEFYEVTESYLVLHPEIELSVLEIMDKVYLEMMFKNNLAYQRSLLINLKNHILGTSELETLVSNPKYQIESSRIADKLFRNANMFMIAVQTILLWLFLPAIIFFFIKWKSLPDEIVLSALIAGLHILVLAFFSDPIHRFRYGLDPFIYFSQIYLIIILMDSLFFKFKNNLSGQLT